MGKESVCSRPLNSLCTLSYSRTFSLPSPLPPPYRLTLNIREKVLSLPFTQKVANSTKQIQQVCYQSSSYNSGSITYLFPRLRYLKKNCVICCNHSQTGLYLLNHNIITVQHSYRSSLNIFLNQQTYILVNVLLEEIFGLLQYCASHSWLSFWVAYLHSCDFDRLI